MGQANQEAAQAVRKGEATLRGAVEDTEVLLDYASSRGIALPQEVVKALVNSKTLLTGDVNSPATFDQQAAFWDAREKLADAVRPVTIASLKATTQTLGRHGRVGNLIDRLFGEAHFTRADLAVHLFRRWAFWALLVLLVVQVYWVVGSHLTQEITPILQQVQENGRQQDDLRASGKGADAPELQALEAQVIAREKEMAFRFEILRKWNSVWRIPLTAAGLIPPLPDSAHEPAYEALKKAMLIAGFTSHGLERYILPLLYGFLGACLYVLRTLANDIKTQAYTPDLNTLYRLRVYMGTLAGLIVIWFLPVVEAEPRYKSLTPFALAFLAGYSVDLLFALLDKLISAFSSK